MAADNPNTQAFYRFADFEHYYTLRINQDQYLYDLFVSMQGKPRERHPLSFVLQGSDYLHKWFGQGMTTKFPLMDIPSEYISFTLGDSGSTYEKTKTVTMFTKEGLLKLINDYDGTIDDFMADMTSKYHYIEVQLWNDKCLENIHN